MVIRNTECAKRLNAEVMSTRTGRKTTREIGLDGEAGAIATIPMTIMTIVLHVETITVTSGDAVVMNDMMNTCLLNTLSTKNLH